ncbi:MAG TPA: hypothetical protein VGF55_28000 [Gemmataceae bacterium]|jgi:hypothetical protein
MGAPVCGFGRFARRFLSTDPGMVAHFGDPFRPLEPECRVIQFEQPLTPEQLRRAGELVADRPDVQLYVYLRAARDLDFLRYFPKLRRLQVALYSLDDVSGFGHVADTLEDLIFDSTKKTFSLRFLASMPRLTSLFLVRQKKDLSVISGLTGLTKLGLSGITLKDLSLLLPLTALRDLKIFLGGTTNLALLPRLPALEDLHIMRVTKLSDLGMLGEMLGLRRLELVWLRNVTALPSLARLTRLEEVRFETMKGLTDLSAVAAAPALRRLAVHDAPQLTADHFRCLLGHPTLADLWVGTGRTKVNDAVRQMFPAIGR